MSELDKETKAIIEKEASDHAEFLASKVFIPAFKMAYIHGYKHGRGDVVNERFKKTPQP